MGSKGKHKLAHGLFYVLNKDGIYVKPWIHAFISTVCTEEIEAQVKVRLTVVVQRDGLPKIAFIPIKGI